ncbi:trehalose-phosphatase [Chloroflexota bacterium]
MKHLFETWGTFASDAGVASHIILLSDYDGTLTPIVSRPEEAVLSHETREKLRTLTEKPAFRVGIISGRSLPEVKSLVGLAGIYYAGNHGLEIEGPGLKFIHTLTKASQSRIQDLHRQLSTRLANIDGVIVEDKGLTLSVHYRLVRKNEEEMVARIFRQITSPWLRDGKIKVTSGKKVWEVRPPAEWHKGKAVETIMSKIQDSLGNGQALTIYLGDDTTDEDAFGAIHQLHGWGILVGRENASSSAGYFLGSTAEVMTFLSRLCDLK